MSTSSNQQIVTDSDILMFQRETDSFVTYWNVTFNRLPNSPQLQVQFGPQGQPVARGSWVDPSLTKKKNSGG